MPPNEEPAAGLRYAAPVAEMDAAAPADGGEAKPATVDSRELRQRMLVAFSANEMAELAATLGVATSGTSAEASAREIVRSYERKGDLEGLLERLRAERPLLEWPAHSPETAAEDPSSPEGTEAFVSNEAPAATATEGPSPRDEAGQPSGTPVDAPAPSAPWPGNEPTEPEAANRERGLDPRILVLVSGLTVIAALIAFAAGRASSGSSRGAAEAAKTSAPHRRPAGPATHAADAISRSLAGVAGACEIPASDDADVLQRAVEHCGPAPRPRLTPDAPDLAMSAAPAASDDPGPGRYGIPAPTPAARAPAEGTCLRGCAATYAACGGRCGKEPTQGTQYADYQLCLAKCLSSASKCRLACQ